tara:strand:+ start:235 stop:540 length:306 start_codon:yes stop_codon:yes gene_type:complete
MKQVIIYKPEKSPTQSGIKKYSNWFLESINVGSFETDPLTGWKGKEEYEFSIKLKFNTKEEAIAYAKKNKMSYKVVKQASKIMKLKSYADNFKFNRVKTDT